MQNLTLRGGDGTAEHPAVGRIGWRRHWPNTAGRCAALPFPRPPTNHQTHYRWHSAQKTPSFLFNSGTAVGRGAAGAYWHLISWQRVIKSRPGFDSLRLRCCFYYPLTLFAEPLLCASSPVTLDTHHRLSSMDNAKRESLNVKLVYA